eukprot:1320531-Amphidinium_carterae.1
MVILRVKDSRGISTNLEFEHTLETCCLIFGDAVALSMHTNSLEQSSQEAIQTSRQPFAFQVWAGGKKDHAKPAIANAIADASIEKRSALH